MKNKIPHFEDPSLDRFLARWMSGELTEKELRDWENTLVFDGKLRETVCDWIKTLREPSWLKGFGENGK
jgi:hypothetical protein